MSPGPTPRRSQLVLVEPAPSRLGRLTATEPHCLDCVVAISVNPDLGTPVPDALLCDYTDDVDGSRVI